MIITQTQLGVDLVGCPTVCTSDIGILDKSFISVMFIWLIWLPIHYLTQNPCFSIPFQLYIHDHHWNQAGCRLRMVANMYGHPTLVFWLKIWYSATFIWLMWLPIHYLTQNPWISIPFHLYIRDHHSNQAGCRLSWVANMYVHLILAFWFKICYSATFIWLMWLPIL